MIFSAGSARRAFTESAPSCFAHASPACSPDITPLRLSVRYTVFDRLAPVAQSCSSRAPPSPIARSNSPVVTALRRTPVVESAAVNPDDDRALLTGVGGRKYVEVEAVLGGVPVGFRQLNAGGREGLGLPDARPGNDRLRFLPPELAERR